MGNISVKINLAAFKNATILELGKNKTPCIVIPIEQNHFFQSEKGAIYLDMQAFPLKAPKADSKDTHLVVQSLPKAVRDKQTEAEKKENKILGNLIDWDANGGGGGQTEQGAKKVASEDDLPF